MPRSVLLAVLLAGAVLPGGASAAGWPTFGGDLARTGFNPAEQQLTPATAGTLREAWTLRLGGVLNAEPVVAGDTVVAASENGTVAAAALDGGRERWRRTLPARRHAKCFDLPGKRYGISATPVIDGNRVYVVADDGRAYALSFQDGHTLPGWPVKVLEQPALEYVWGAPALRRGVLYIPAASRCDETFYHGEVVALAVRSRRLTGRWSAVPRGHGGGVWGWGGVAVDRRTGRLFAATANAQGRGGEDRPYGEHIVALSPRLELVAADHPGVPTTDDADFGGHPVLLDAAGCPPLLIAMHKTGAAVLYDRRRIARGPRQRLQVGDPTEHNELGTYAWSPAERTVYFARAGDGARKRGLEAWRLGDDCRLHLRWALPVGTVLRPGPPSLNAGGIVAWAGGLDETVHVADAATGRLVADLPVGARAVGGVTIAAGAILVPAWDGRVHAFALP